MELSELTYFNDRLYTCDDRTGILYEVFLDRKLVVPQHIFTGGDGRSTSKGFKCEWLAVKDSSLYIGSIGKEYVQDNVIVNHHGEWIKTIDISGKIEHHDWTDIYNNMRKATGASFPGYLIHEAAGWSQQFNQWVFLPRRHSTDPYDDALDERKGTNIGIIADENFKIIKTIKVGRLDPVLGVSSFKFVPFRENHIIVLKTEENGERIRTIVFVFDIVNGIMLSDEVEVSDTIKFEGIEFI